MNNLIIFILGLALGIIATILFILYLFRIKCPNCQKKNPLREIITLGKQDKWEIKGQICWKCEQREKNQETDEIMF